MGGIQSIGLHDGPEVFAAKLEKIVEVQPAEKPSPDITKGTSKAKLGENEVETHITKLEKTLDMQGVGQALPDVAQGAPRSSFDEKRVGQTEKQQNKTDTVSFQNEAKEAQGLQVKYQKGDTSPSVTEGVTADHHSKCTKGVCELNVGGQSLSHNLAQSDLSTTHLKPAASSESHTADRKVVCFLLNEADFPSTNLSKTGPTELAVNDLEAQHPQVATPQSTAKPLPEEIEQLGVKKPPSIEGLAKAVPNEPDIEMAEVHVSDPEAERMPQKATQAVYSAQEGTSVVTQQAKAEREDSAQDQAFKDSVPDLLESAEKPVNAPEEECKLELSLVPTKKKLCCTML